MTTPTTPQPDVGTSADVVLPLFSALEALPSDATVQDLVDAGASTLSIGTVAVLLGKRVRDVGFASFEQMILDFVETTDVAPGLSMISEGVSVSKDVVSTCLRTMVKDGRLSETGDKRATVYFVGDTAPTEDQIQKDILNVMRSAEGPVSKPSVVAAVSGNALPATAVRRGLAALVEAGAVSRSGVARGTVFSVVGHQYPDPTPIAVDPAPAPAA